MEQESGGVMEDLRSGIEHLKQAKAHMSEANGIMSDYISKLRELEEENAGLRAKLEALIQSDDSYMKLPLDADGVPIRLKDWVWYVGIDAEIAKDDPRQVVGLVSDLGMNGIYAVTRDYPDKAISPKMLTHRAPEPPDSWAKLEEGVMKWSCSYFGIDQDAASCDDCPHGLKQTGNACWLNARLDMLARAKKLAGIEEEAER